MCWKIKHWAIFGNEWLWFHILAGGVLARLGLLLLDQAQTMLAVLLLAIGWEVYEYLTDDIIKVYGSVERFLYDAGGDIVGALLCALIVVI